MFFYGAQKQNIHLYLHVAWASENMSVSLSHYTAERGSLYSPTVDEWFPGKVCLRQSVDLFAVTGGGGGGGGGFLGEPGNADWLMLGLPADQCCCGTTQLTADNEQHTLLIGRVSSTTPQKKRAPAIMGPVAQELGSQRGDWGPEARSPPVSLSCQASHSILYMKRHHAFNITF